MKKKIISLLLITILLGGNMGFCSNADSRDNKIITNENKITNEEIKELITAYNEDILKIIKKEK